MGIRFSILFCLTFFSVSVKGESCRIGSPKCNIDSGYSRIFGNNFLKKNGKAVFPVIDFYVNKTYILESDSLNRIDTLFSESPILDIKLIDISENVLRFYHSTATGGFYISCVDLATKKKVNEFDCARVIEKEGIASSPFTIKASGSDFIFFYSLNKTVVAYIYSVNATDSRKEYALENFPVAFDVSVDQKKLVYVAKINGRATIKQINLGDTTPNEKTIKKLKTIDSVASWGVRLTSEDGVIAWCVKKNKNSIIFNRRENILINGEITSIEEDLNDYILVGINYKSGNFYNINATLSNTETIQYSIGLSTDLRSKICSILFDESIKATF